MAAQLPPVAVQPVVPPVAPPAIVLPAAVAPAVIYHLYPGRARDPNAAWIDFSLESERKMHRAATASLIDKYDLSPAKLQSFLNRIKERISQYGWERVVNIAMPNNAAGMATPPINLVTNYGQVSAAQIRNHANVYMNQHGLIGQQSVMLYMCIRNSLEIAAHNSLDLDQSKYTVNGEFEGALFLKEIITKAYVDTNATIDTIRKSISKLDTKIKEFNFDIKLFNAYVQTQVNAMAAHGATCSELITNLFEAYYQVKDDEFEQHVRSYYFHYTRAGMQGITEDLTTELMLAMEQHYHRRLITNTWDIKNQTKTDKDRIIALEATIDKLKHSPPPRTDNKQRKDRQTDKAKDRWAWKKVAPAKGKPTMVKKNKKTYHWCPKHKQWTIHTPEECHLDANNVANSVSEEADDDGSDDSIQKKPAKMHIDPALSTVTDTSRYFN